MSDLTGSQRLEYRQLLEDSAALVLGRIQLEFSRLELSIGLCAVWVDQGQRLTDLTPQVEAMSFHKKLEFIEAAVERNVRRKSASYEGYKSWIQRAQETRVKRNEFIHGRWGVEAVSQEVINVLGLPTSSSQVVRRYKISELEAFLDELKNLQKLLHRLGDQKPL